MNVAYGKPEEQMFDIKRRRPISYELPEGGDKDQVQRVTKSLSKSIEAALRTILNEVVLPAKGETGAKRFQTIRDQFEASVRDGSFHGIYHGCGAIAICLVPHVAAMLDHPILQQLCLPLIYADGGQPELRGRSVLWVGKYNFTGAHEADRACVTEILRDGTVLAADTLALYPDSETSRHYGNGGGIIHRHEIEKAVIQSVVRYGRALRDLGVSLPWRLGVSLLAIHGYRMPPPTGSLASRDPNSHQLGRVPDRTYNLVADPVLLRRYEDVDSEGAAAQTLKGCFDYFSRECTYPGSFSYDKNGNWKGPQ
jgi:hypothetical protein